MENEAQKSPAGNPEPPQDQRPGVHSRKDAIFASEEAVDFEKGTVADYDNTFEAAWSKKPDETVPDVPSTTDYH